MTVISLGVFFVATASSLYGLGQKFAFDILFKQRLGLEMKELEGRPEGLTPVWAKRINGKLTDTRVIGPSGNTNFFAGFLVTCLPFLLFLSVEVNKWFLLSILLVVATIVATRCRGAVLGLLVGALFFLLIVSWKGWVFDFLLFAFSWNIKWLFVVKLVILSAIINVVVVRILDNPSVIKQLKRLHDKNNSFSNSFSLKGTDQEDPIAHLRYRIRYWKAALELIRQKPLHGFGLRTYRKEVYQAQAKLHDKDSKFLNEEYQTPQPREVHNDYLENFVEGGVIGGLSFLLILGLVIYHGSSLLIGDVSGQEFLLGAVILSGLVVVLLHTFFFFPLRLGPSAMLFWISLAMIESLSVSSKVVTFTPNVFISIILFAGLCALIWEGCVKPNVGNYYFLKYIFAKDVEKKEKYLLEATKICPKETIFRTHFAIGYFDTYPDQAERHAEIMYRFYDGMTPAWQMYYNVGIAKLLNKKWAEAFEFFNHSLYYYPRFESALQRMQEIYALIPLPKRRLVVKQISQEGAASIKVHQVEIEKHHALIQNVVLAEKIKLNIPLEWPYNVEMGTFMSPREAEEFRKQQEKKQLQGSTGPLGVVK